MRLAPILEMGKNPHCLSSVLFGFSGSFQLRKKMKVRFGFGSLCRVFGSVRFGSSHNAGSSSVRSVGLLFDFHL